MKLLLRLAVLATVAVALCLAGPSTTSDFKLISPFHIPYLLRQTTESGTDACVLPDEATLKCLDERGVPVTTENVLTDQVFQDKIRSGTIQNKNQAIPLPTWSFPAGTDKVDGSQSFYITVATLNGDSTISDEEVQVIALAFLPNRERNSEEAQQEAEEISARYISLPNGRRAGPMTESEFTQAGMRLESREHQNTDEYKLEELNDWNRFLLALNSQLESTFSIFASFRKLSGERASDRVTGRGSTNEELAEAVADRVPKADLACLKWGDDPVETECPGKVCDVLFNIDDPANAGVPASHSTGQMISAKIVIEEPQEGDPAWEQGLRIGDYDYNGPLGVTMKVNGQIQCGMIWVEHGPFKVLGDSAIVYILVGAAIVGAGTAGAVYKREKSKREKAAAGLDKEGDAEAGLAKSDEKADLEMINGPQDPVVATASEGAGVAAAAPASRAVMLGRRARSASRSSLEGRRVSTGSTGSAGSKGSKGSKGSRAKTKSVDAKVADADGASVGSAAAGTGEGKKRRRKSKASSGAGGKHSKGSRASGGSRASKGSRASGGKQAGRASNGSRAGKGSRGSRASKGSRGSMS